MTQAEALGALWRLNAGRDWQWMTAADVAGYLADEPKAVTMALLRAYRNGRCGTEWWVAGGPGSGCFVYLVTRKGAMYVQWVEDQQAQDWAAYA